MEVSINYFAIVVAAISAMILGFLWYGPLFKKSWMNLMGFTEESVKQMKLTPVQSMVGGFITMLIMAYVLTHFIVFAEAFYQEGGLMTGFLTGFWVWLGFLVPVTGSAFLWEGKRFALWVLNGGYWLVALLVMGSILGAWM